MGVLETKYHMEIAPEWFSSVPRILGNGFGIIFECESSFFGHVFTFELILFKIWEFWGDISTCTNQSGPGTPFKMCSRSWQYWRFEYHQKLLTQKWSYGQTKLTYLIFGTFPIDINSHECQHCISWEFSLGIQLKPNSAGVQDQICAWNDVLLVLGCQSRWELAISVHSCWHRTERLHFLGLRHFGSKKKLSSKPGSQQASHPARQQGSQWIMEAVRLT